jgi:hypothetical protein
MNVSQHRSDWKKLNATVNVFFRQNLVDQDGSADDGSDRRALGSVNHARVLNTVGVKPEKIIVLRENDAIFEQCTRRMRIIRRRAKSSHRDGQHVDAALSQSERAGTVHVFVPVELQAAFSSPLRSASLLRSIGGDWRRSESTKARPFSIDWTPRRNPARPHQIVELSLACPMFSAHNHQAQ